MALKNNHGLIERIPGASLLNKWIILLSCSLLLLSKSASAVDPDLDWKTIESEHLFVHYADSNKAIAERALAITESAHQRLTKELNWYPEEKTHLILSDETDQPNGYATPLFFNRTVIFLAPPTSVNTLEDFDDWLTTIIVHEYTHVIHLDKSAGSPESLRNLFGRFILLFPNLFQPSWVLEGLATQKETDIDRGIGRGQSAMFASMMREEVVKGLQPLSHVNLPVASWPAGTTRYLYGVYFMDFVAERYGADKLQQWVEAFSNNLLPFFINSTATQVLGKDLTLLWEEYHQWLNDKFQPQIDMIKAKGIKAGRQVSKDAYRTSSVRAVLNKKGEEVYYVQNSGYKRASLVRLNSSGETEELLDLNNGAQLDLHAEAGLLLTQNEYCNYYTIYSDIYLYDAASNKLKRLTECGRYLFASWFPDGEQIIAVHHNATKFELQLLDNRAQLKEVLWQATSGEIIGQVDVSPDGKNIVASVWRKGDGWNIELFNVEYKQWKKITHGASVAANPQFTADGNILFSMEAESVYNLYRYHTKTEEVAQLTNLVGGAFQSSQASLDSPIYYAGYSAEGFAIYVLDVDNTAIERLTQHNEGSGKAADAAAFNKAYTFNDDHLQLIDYTITSQPQTDYSALSSISPRWWFPVYEYSEQRSEFGITTSGSDALAIHNYFITASYDSKLEKPAASISYSYADRLFLSLARINEIYLDINGNLNRISKRNVASAIMAFRNRRVQRQSDLLFGLIYDSTADAELVNGALPSDNFEDHLLGVAWLYNSADFNPLSISLIDGMRLRLVAEDSDALNADFTGQVYTLDWQQYIRTGKESVFAIRFLQGWGTDQPQPFRLGGEGFNDDPVSILFNGVSGEGVFDRREYALRGYKEGLPQLRGRRAQLLTGEWRFPLQRIEKGVMAPPAGIMQWFGAVFAETGSVYQDTPDDYYTSAGLEITADINLFYNLLLRTRLGYAHGFDNDIGENRFYLKIGSSF